MNDVFPATRIRDKGNGKDVCDYMCGVVAPGASRPLPMDAFLHTRPPPCVTISNVAGSVIQYNSVPDSVIDGLQTRATTVSNSPLINSACNATAPTSTGSPGRAWRSHSLTPTGASGTSASSSPPASSPQMVITSSSSSGFLSSEVFGLAPKNRSHSLTLSTVRDWASGVDVTFHSAAADNDAQIEEIAKKLPEGSGIRDLHEWLKSLRLHKYSRLLLEFTYEELLCLSEEDLERKHVTVGARGKILKEVGLVRLRDQKICELMRMVEEVRKASDLPKLERILPEVEKLILMPLKPVPTTKTLNVTTSLSSDPCRRAGGVAEGVAVGRWLRHDSGSDSGTDLNSEEPTQLNEGDTILPLTDNIPQAIFDLLKNIYSVILVNEGCSHSVVTIFVCLLERCMIKEAFTVHHKQSFTAWLHRLRTVWNPPSIKKSNDYKRKSSRDVGIRRSSFQGVRSFAAGMAFPRPPSAATMKNNGCLLGAGLHGGGALFHERFEMPPVPMALQRRSVPDINPAAALIYPQKRNSYQGDNRSNPHQFGLSCVDPTSPLLPDSFAPSALSSAGQRRESTFSCDSGLYLSLPDSRRSSSIFSSEASRRDSAMSEDGRDLFLAPGSGLAPIDRRDSFDFGLPAPPPCTMFPGTTSLVSGLRGAYASHSASHSSGVSAATCGSRAGLGISAYMGLHGLGGFPPAGSLSSGCPSDGSTDSLLEQDLHKLSLSVTEQALE